jgi:diguanylate cyclase (GGDEF)-like protein
MLDLDHFKKINDTYGHLTGDDVLKEAANRVMRSTRSYDLVGRYGGEEFLIVLPGCDSAQLPQAAERIRRTIGDTPILTLNSSPGVTASIGATVCVDNSSAEEALAVADAALYQAKHSGRDQVAIL